MPQFDVRLAGESDRDAVLAMIGKWVPDNPAERFAWLYRSNPHGQALTWIAVTRDTGEPAGCTSMFPRRIRADRRERLGAIGGDCFVERKFRRMGLATALHRASVQGMREHGVEFMFGPPNRNNLGALIKAGSHLVTRYVRWGRTIGARPEDHSAGLVARARARVSQRYLDAVDLLAVRDTRGFTIERVERFGAEFDSLAQEITARNVVVCLRDREYLEWRYLASPSRAQIPLAIRRDGVLQAFVALETRDGAAQVRDIVGRPDERVLDATIGLTVRHAALAGAHDVEICMTAASPISRRLRRSGFAVRSEDGFQVAGAHDDAQAALLLAPDAWRFSSADQDVDSAFARRDEEP